MSAHGLKITNFHYGHMKMPDGPSTFVEWPKWVHRDGQPSVLVANAEEEAAIMSGAKQEAAPEVVAPVVAAAAVLTGSNDEKAILLQIAKEKGIKVDARWRIEKIRAAMEAAQP